MYFSCLFNSNSKKASKTITVNKNKVFIYFEIKILYTFEIILFLNISVK